VPLVRIEQLVSACKAHGGRAAAEDDPMLAQLVAPHGDDWPAPEFSDSRPG
jgi:hypothetical protein